jgi:RNA-directed DNA polymerase
MEANYLSQEGAQRSMGMELRHSQQRPIAVRENRQWKPGVSYCRHADDFVVVVKGTRAHAEAIRKACRTFLEGTLTLTLNIEKPISPT